MIDEKKLIEEIIKIYPMMINEFGMTINDFVPKLLDIINNQPKVSKWILCEVAMPKEHDSMFAKWKGTDKWNNAMFEKISDDVNVTIEYTDGKRQTCTMHTTDGKWKFSTSFTEKKVIAWQPLPEPYKKCNTDGDTNNDSTEK